MDKVYQTVMTFKDSKRVIHLGMFSTQEDAVECMIAAKHEGEVYSKQVWQHDLFTGKWDGVINYAEDLTDNLE